MPVSRYSMDSCPNSSINVFMSLIGSLTAVGPNPIHQRFTSFVTHSLRWVNIQSINLQVEHVVPRVAASNVKVQPPAFAVFEIGVYNM